jgi:hypothetical protein
LVLWLEPGGIKFGAAGEFVRWTDESGASPRNDALAYGAGDPTTPAPTATPCPLPDEVGLHFDRSSLQIDDAAALRISGDVALFAVARYTNLPPPADLHGPPDAYGLLYTKAAGSGGLSFLLNHPQDGTFGNLASGLRAQVRDSNLLLSDSAATSSVAGCNDGRLRVYGVRRVTSGLAHRLELYVNGTGAGSAGVATVDISAPGQPIYIGGNGAGTSQHVQGDLFELVLVNGPTSDLDLALLTGYLLDRYGL